MKLFHTDSFAFIKLSMEINRLVFNSMEIQAVTQRDNARHWDDIFLKVTSSEVESFR